MSKKHDDNKEQDLSEDNGNTKIKYQLKVVFFLFICFVLGFLVTFSIVKFD